MPNGGQIPSGQGLRLQPTSPGVTDSGNAHVSGTIIADAAVWGQGTTTGATPGIMGAGGPLDVAVVDKTQWHFLSYPNLLIGGYASQIQDSNVIQQSIFMGHLQGIGANSHVGLASMCIVGNQITAYTSGNAGNNLGTTIFGNLNKCNRGTGAVSNLGALIIGYNNNDQGADNSVSGRYNTIIGHNVSINGLGNVTIIGSLQLDAAPTTSNTVKIGNSAQTIATVGAYDVAAMSRSVFKQTASVTVANSVAESTLVGTGTGTLSFPASSFLVGSTIKIKARGTIGSTGTPTIRLRFKVGSTYIDTGAVTLPVITGTNGWQFEGDVTIRTTGAGGTAIGNGKFSFSTGGTAVAGIITTNSATTGIDTTVGQTAGFTVQWGTADPANSITCTNLTCEVMT